MEDFYNTPSEIKQYTDFMVEDKITKIEGGNKRYYFIVSEPRTYRLFTLEVGKTTFNTYVEGDYLD